MDTMTFCVPCLFGLEGLVGDELRRLDLQNVRVEDRRVFFEGDFAAMAKANLCCRMGERVMILLAEFDAHSFEDLFQGVKAVPLVSGKGAYILSIFSNMLHGLTADYTVTLDSGEVFSGRKTMICVCNGRWYGGSFNPVTDSEPDDGILDVLVVEKVNLLQVATVVGDYQKGRYQDHPTLIRRCPCRSLRIECAKKSVVNVDGEAVYTTDAKIEVVPQAIRFFYPKGLTYHTKNSQSGHKFAEITP